MHLTEWSADTLQYELSDEYSIRLADVTEWGLFCTIYYDMGYVGFFREEEFSSTRCSAYWIYRRENKIFLRRKRNEGSHFNRYSRNSKKKLLANRGDLVRSPSLVQLLKKRL